MVPRVIWYSLKVEPVDKITKGDGRFRTTRWSVVLEAGDPSAATRNALETLCRSYWHPLYWFVRRSGYGEVEAKDLTQEFFLRLIESDALSSAQPEKGRFRTFLLAVMKHFLATEWRDANRQKRGGGVTILAWDELNLVEHEHLEPADPTRAEDLFDKQWAQTVVRTSVDNLAWEWERDGLAARFAELKRFLQGDSGGGSYVDAAAKLGLSEGAIKSAIFRMRRRYAELLREEISQTLADPADIDDEIRHLIKVLAS